jgi:hypothetical protein
VQLCAGQASIAHRLGWKVERIIATAQEAVTKLRPPKVVKRSGLPSRMPSSSTRATRLAAFRRNARSEDPKRAAIHGKAHAVRI